MLDTILIAIYVQDRGPETNFSLWSVLEGKYHNELLEGRFRYFWIKHRWDKYAVNDEDEDIRTWFEQNTFEDENFCDHVSYKMRFIYRDILSLKKDFVSYGIQPYANVVVGKKYSNMDIFLYYNHLCSELWVLILSFLDVENDDLFLFEQFERLKPYSSFSHIFEKDVVNKKVPVLSMFENIKKPMVRIWSMCACCDYYHYHFKKLEIGNYFSNPVKKKKI